MKDIGAVPGTPVFNGIKKVDKSTIRIIAYNQAQIIEKEINNINEADEFINSDHTTWINVYGLHHTGIINEISKKFKLDDLLVEDILNTDHIPKYEENEKYRAMILKQISYNKENNNITSSQIAVIFGKNYVLTLQEEPLGNFDKLRERMRKSVGRIRKRKADYLLFGILDTLIDNYLYSLSQLGQQIEDTGKRIFISQKHNLEEDIFKNKIEIGYLRMQIRPVKEMLTRLLSLQINFIAKENKAFYNDLIELLTQTNETIEIYNTLVSDQLSTYNTFVGNRMNQIMKVLTVFASIFIPLTFIAGVYGMNFKYIPELSYQYGYFIFWGIIIFIAGGLLYYFKRNKWL